MRKVILFICLLLVFPMTSDTYAQLAKECTKPLNIKYSFKAFPYHGLSFKDRPASEFNNTCIKGTSFYQEWVEGDIDVVKDIFPDGITGVEFVRCNLDNVEIPSGNTADSKNLNRKIQVQNDWDDWILDALLNPTEPMNKQRRLDAGVSVDPIDIPSKKWTEQEKLANEEIINAILNP